MLPEAMSKETPSRGGLRSQVLRLFVSQLFMRRKNTASFVIPGHDPESSLNPQGCASHAIGYWFSSAWRIYCLPDSTTITRPAT